MTRFRRAFVLALAWVFAVARVGRRRFMKMTPKRRSTAQLAIFGFAATLALVSVVSSPVVPQAAAATIRSSSGSDACTVDVGTAANATVVKNGNYCVVTVTASTTVSIPSYVSTIGIIVVGGGAGAYSDGGSGGSGGEVRANNAQVVTPGGSVSVTIGAGGAGGSWTAGTAPGTGASTFVSGAGISYEAKPGRTGSGWGNSVGPSGGSGGYGGTGYVGGTAGGGPGGTCDPIRWGGAGGAGPQISIGGFGSTYFSGGGGGGSGFQTYNSSSGAGLGPAGGSGGGGRGSNYRYALDDSTWIDGASRGHDATFYGGGGGGGAACNAFSGNSVDNGIRQRTDGGSGYQGVAVMSWLSNKIAIVQAPDGCVTNATEGCLIAAKVQLRDINDNNLATSGISVTVFSNSGSAAGTTTVLSNSSGEATFDNFYLTGATSGSTVTLTFEAVGYRNVQTTITVYQYAETLTMVSGSSDTNGAFIATTGVWLATGSNSNVSVTTVQNQLAARNVTLRAHSSSSSVGNVVIDSAANMTSAASSTRTITIRSSRNVLFNGGSRIASSTQPLNVVVQSNYDNQNGGMVWMAGTTANYAIDTNGGHVAIGGGSATTSWNGLSVPSGYSTGMSASTGSWWGIELGVNTNSSGLLLIRTNGGNARLYGESQASTGATHLYGISWESGRIDLASGDLTLNGKTTGSPTIASSDNWGVGIGANHGTTNDAPILNTSGTAYATGSIGTPGTSNYWAVAIGYANLNTGLSGLNVESAQRSIIWEGSSFQGPVSLNANYVQLTGSNSFRDGVSLTATSSDVYIGGSQTVTGTGKHMRFTATADVETADSTTLQTNGGNIVFWSNADKAAGVANNSGRVYLGLNNTLKSQGGKIWLAGGLDDGGADASITTAKGAFDAVAAGDDLPDGYGVGNSATNEAPGAHLSTGYLISSAGGDIFIAGMNSPTSSGGLVATVMMTSGLVDSGTGRIGIWGRSYSNSSANMGVTLHHTNATDDTTIYSANRTAKAITIYGDSGPSTNGDSDGVSAWGHGPLSNRWGYTSTHLIATGLRNTSDLANMPGGGINVTGIGANVAGASGGHGIVWQWADAIALDGSVTLTGEEFSSAGSYAAAGIYIGQNNASTYSRFGAWTAWNGRTTNTWTDQAGNVIDMSTSATNITLNATKFVFYEYADAVVAEGYVFKTTGDITIQSVGSTWNEDQTSTHWQFGRITILGNPRDVTIGKSTDTKRFNWWYDVNATGKISFNAGYVYLHTNVDLKTTLNKAVSGSPNTGILIRSMNRFQANWNNLFQTSGADITFWSDFDNSGDGAMYLDGSTRIISNGGKITIAGGADDGAANFPEITGRVAGDGYPDNYNAGYNGFGANAGVDILGVYQILSGGGDIFIAGRGSAVSGDADYGVLLRGGLIYSSSGKIAIYGKTPASCEANWHRGIGFGWAGDGGQSDNIISDSTASDAILLRGEASSCNSGGSVYANAIQGFYSAGANIVAPNGGGVKIHGTSGNASYYYGTSGNDYQSSSVLELNYVNVLANSGDIQIIASRSAAGAHDVRYGTRGTSQTNNVGASTANISTGVAAYPTISVTSSSSDVTVTSDTSYFRNGFIRATGDLVIQPNNANFSSTLAQNYFASPGSPFPATYESVRIGKAGTNGSTQSSGDVTVARLNSRGPISIYASNVVVDDGLTTSSASGTGIFVKAKDDITFSAGTSAAPEPISVTGTNSTAPITVWANADATGEGYIYVNNYNHFTTQGAPIVMGGSSTAAATSPDTYAVSTTAGYAGIRLGTSNGLSNSNVKLTSNGGDITLRGKSTGTSSWGILTYGGLNINSGSGRILMDGYATNTGNGFDFEQTASNLSTITSAATSNATPAVLITGKCDSATSSDAGQRAIYTGGTGLTISATNGGDVSLIGDNAAVQTTNPGSIYLTGVDVLASTGKVTIDGGSDGVVTSTSSTTSNLGAISSGSATGDVTVIGDRLTSAGTTNVKTTGNVSFESSGSTFVVDTTMSGTNVAAGAREFRLGKTTNTSNVTTSGSISVTGTVEIYGFDLNLNSSISVTAGSGGILAKARRNITSGNSLSYSTSGGDITFWSRSVSADTSTDEGEIQLGNATSITSNGGRITMAGSSSSAAGIPTGYAYSTDSLAVALGASSTGAASTISSGGGNIVVEGKTGSSGWHGFGIRSTTQSTIDAGSGRITFDLITAGTDNAFEAWNGGAKILSSASAGATPAISITALQTNSSTGIEALQLPATLEINASGGGDLYLKAVASDVDVYSFRPASTQFLASGGTITLDAGAQGISFADANVTWIGANSTGSSTANVKIYAGRIEDSASDNRINFKTSGDVSIEPVNSSSSFSTASTFDNSFVFTGVDDLTIGNAVNNSAVTSSGNFTVAGDITILAGNVTTSGNLTTTGLDKRINLKAKTTVQTAAAKTLRTNSGKIVIWADSDASGGGAAIIKGTLCSAPTATNCDSSAVSGGDEVVIGGGAASATDSSLPGGYATGYGVATNVETTGVQFGTMGTANTGPKIYSSGGNISVKGRSYVTAGSVTPGAFGAMLMSGTEVYAGAGKILFEGNVATASSAGFRYPIEWNAWGGTSVFSSTNADADSITVRAVETYASNGLHINNAGGEFRNPNGGFLIQANTFMSDNKMTINVAGPYVYEPVDTSFSATLTLDSDFVFNATTKPSSIRVGKNGNLADITVNIPLIANGAIDVIGKTITTNSDLTVNTSQLGGVTLKGTQDVDIAAGASADRTVLQTNGGPITLWSNSDASGSGAIRVGNFTRFASNGGAITFAGSTTNSDTSPTGAAKNNGTSTFGNGVELGSSGNTNNVEIASANGDVTIRGYSNANTTNMFGIRPAHGLNINAGNGSILMEGTTDGCTLSNNCHGVEFGHTLGTVATNIISTKATGTAISISGSTINSTSSDSVGLSAWNQTSSNPLNIKATGGGKIVLTGNTTSQNTVCATRLNGTNVIGAGDIEITSTNKCLTLAPYAGDTKNVVIGAETNASAAPGNVILKADDIQFNNHLTTIRNSGNLVLESNSASFSAAQVINSARIAIDGTNQFRWGKTGNSADLTLSQATTFGGVVTINAGVFTNNAALTTSNDDISITADQVSIAASLSTTSTSGGIVSIVPRSSAKNIELGAADSATLLGLTATELGNVTAKTLRIGESTRTGNIAVSSDISLASNKVTDLALRASGNITGTGVITVTNLGVAAGGTINLSGNNLVSGLVALTAVGASGGTGLSFSAGANFTPGTVDSISGVYGVAHELRVTAIPAINGQAQDAFMAVAFNPPPVATIYDQYGYALSSRNLTAGAYTVAAAIATGSGSIAGTTSLATTSGNATFSNLKIASATGSHTLTFTATKTSDSTALSGTSAVTTGTYNVLAGEPASIALTVGSTSAPAGKTGFGISATLKDSAGNTIVSGTHANAAITLTVADAVDDGISTNNAAIIAGGSPSTVAGVADFTGLRLSGKTGITYRLNFEVTYTDTSNTLVTRTVTQDVSLTPGDATQLSVSRLAAGFANRTNFSVQPQVTVLDAYENPVTSSSAVITVEISGGTIALTGTASATASSGVATFAGLGKEGTVATTKTLTFKSSGLTDATQTFTLTHGVATQLVATSAPTSVRAGQTSAATTLQLRDQDGNVVTTGDAATAVLEVSVARTAGGSAATFTDSGFSAPMVQFRRAAVAGEVTFSGLKLEGTKGIHAFTYSVVSPAGYSAISEDVEVELTPGVAASLNVVEQPTSIVANVAISPVVKVELLDAWNNRVTQDAASVTPVLVDSTTTSTVHDSTKAAVSATNGLVTFTGLTFTKAGSVKIRFDSGALTSIYSSTFTITHGEAHHLDWMSAEPASVRSGFALSPAPQFDVEDEWGNKVTSGPSTEVTVSISSANSADVLSITGGTVSTASGSARIDFNNLVLVAKAANYKLKFTASNSGKAIDSTFVETASTVAVTYGVAHSLAKTVEASGSVRAGFNFATQPVLTIKDSAGNTVADSDFTVTASLPSVSNNAQNLTGTTSRIAASGVANFDLNTSKLGASGDIADDITLRFTATNGTTTLTADQLFDLTPGTAVALQVSEEPTTVKRRIAMSPAPAVELLDAYGNVVTGDSNSTVAVTVYANAGTATLTDDTVALAESTAVTAASGVVSFSNLVLTNAPATNGYYLKFRFVETGATATSVDFTLNPGNLSRIEYVTQPSTVNAQNERSMTGELLKVQPVLKLVDQDGYTVTTQNSGSVTAAITTGANGDLSEGSTSATISAGVATFSGMKLVGTPQGVNPKVDYKLTFSFNSVDSAESDPMYVTNNVAHHLASLRSPGIGQAGVALSGTATPQVEVLDRYGNRVLNAAGQIRVSLSAAAPVVGTPTLTGSTQVSLASGVATFNIGINGRTENSYTFSYSYLADANVTGVSQTGITITDGDIDRLVITQAPSTVDANSVRNKTGEVLKVQPVVEFRDAHGNKVEAASEELIVSIAGSVFDARDRLTGTIKAPVNGVVTFDQLALIGRPGHAYELTFTSRSDANLSVTTANAALVVTHADAHHLTITRQPNSIVSGLIKIATGSALPTQPIVEVRDFDDNVVTSLTSGQYLTANVTSGDGATDAVDGGVTNNNQAEIINGVATWSGLKVVATPNTDQKLTFTGLTFTSAESDAFQVSNAVAAKLAISTQPCSGTVSGSTCNLGPTAGVLGQQPVIRILDRFNNLVPDSTATVTVTVSGAGGSLTPSSSLTSNAVGGVATFSGLALTGTPGVDYQLVFTSNGLTGVTSGNVRVKHSSAVRLVMVTHPIGAETGELLATQPVVKVVDTFGNTVIDDSSTVVTVAPSARTLFKANSAPLTATASNGVVTFSGLKFTGTPGVDYTLNFSSGSLEATTSNSFRVTHAAVAELVWETQPSVNQTGEPLTTQPVLKLQDFDHNLVESDNSTVVTATISTGTNGSLHNATATAENGVVTFTNLKLIGIPGTTYKLTFTATIGSSSFAAPESNSLAPAHARPHQLVVTTAASTSGFLIGEVLPQQPVLRVEDRFGNLATSDNSTVVTASIGSGAGGSVSGSTTATANGGIVTFSGLRASGVPGTSYAIGYAASTSDNRSFSVVDSANFTMDKVADQTLSYVDQAYVPFGQAGNLVSPTYTDDSPGAVTFTTTAASTICEVDATTGVITIRGVGSCAVTATVAAAPYYRTHSATDTFVISKAQQDPVVITSADNVDFWSQLTPTASGGSSSVSGYVFSVDGTCQLVGGKVLPGNAGSDCTLFAFKRGDSNYLTSAVTEMTITVNKIAQQTLRIGNLQSANVGDVELFTSGGSGEGAVSYAVDSIGNTAGCSIISGPNGNNLLRATSNGQCDVSATKAASTNFNLALSPLRTFTFTKQDQTVAFSSTIPMNPVVRGFYQPVAASTSGLAVTFSITTGNGTVCEFDATTPTKVNFLAVGICDVRATQAGNSTFNAATATQRITVGALNQTITFPEITNKTFGEPKFRLAATSNSGLAVSYTLGTNVSPQACTVSSTGLVELTAAGSCEIVATQPGNSIYLAAPPVTRVFEIAADQAGKPRVVSISAGNQWFAATFTRPSYLGGAEVLSYRLQLTDTNGDRYANSACSAAASANGEITCTVVGIPNGIAYTAQVAAITRAGLGLYSDVVGPLTPAAQTQGVTNLAAVASSGTLTISYDAPLVTDSPVVGYEIYVAPTGGTFGTPTTTTSLTADISIASIQASSLRAARLQAANSSQATGGWFRRASVASPSASATPSPTSAASAGYMVKVVTITQTPDPNIVDPDAYTTEGIHIGTTVPAEPRALVSSLVDGVNGSKSIFIAWSAPIADGGSAITGYNVEVNGTPICAATALLSCELTETRAGTTYVISVAAVNSVGSSAITSTTHIIPAPPAEPAPVVTPTPTPTVTPSPTVTPTPTVTPRPTSTPRPTTRPTTRPSTSAAPSASASSSVKPSTSPSASPSATASPKPSQSPSPSDTSDIALPSPQPTDLPPAIIPGFNLPNFDPGAPVANPAIGATGDDDAPPQPFDPLANPESVVALTDTTAEIAAIAGSLAAAAGAAAAAAAAAGAAAGAAGAAGGSGSGGSGDAGSVATIDAGHERYENRRRGRGDRWRIWRRRFMTWLDKPTIALGIKSAKFSPLFSRIVIDAAYLRASIGSFSGLVTIANVALAIGALVHNQGSIEPPHWQLFIAISVIGIFDTFAGAAATVVFVVGAISTHLLSGGELALNDIRMLLGVVIVGFGPALIANAFRNFRKVPQAGDVYWWERIIDLGVLPFIGGWTTASMISTLPALAGVTLAAANHVNDFSVAVAVAIMFRVIIEEVVARYFPIRLDMLHPTDVDEPAPYQRWTALAVRLGVFIFVTAALMGNDWRVWLGSALFVLPTVLGWYADRWPNYPVIWRIMPIGIPGLALTLLVASLTTELVNGWFGPTPDLALWSFALLPIPMLAISVLMMFGREGNEGEVRWIQQPRFVWLFRIGGIVMFFVTLKLAGII